MVRRRLAAALALGALAACSPDQPVPSGPAVSASLSSAASLEAAERRHLVVFADQIPADLDARVEALGGTIAARFGQIGVATVAGLTDEAVAQLSQSGDVEVVDVEQEVALDAPTFVTEPESMEGATLDGSVASEAQSIANPAGAFFFPRQWHMRQIGAHTAWAAGKLGSPTTKVFILDTGLDYGHADLAGKVDLSLSKSFIPSDDNYLATQHPVPAFRSAHPIADMNFHGTHVAATVSSNGLVGAGVTSRVTLVGVKVLARDGFSRGSSVIDGMLYAADKDADVINMSLGGGFFRNSNPAALETINRVVSYVREQGTLLVVAAGNSNLDMQHMNRYSTATVNAASYYATYCDAPNVICVSATGPSSAFFPPVPNQWNGPWFNIDAKAPYSNFGNKIFVAAPGGSQFTGGAAPVWAACSRFVPLPPPPASPGLAVCRTSNTFIAGAAGTSMASPHVAGLAALLVDVVGKNNPAQLRAAIKAATDDLGENGRDPIYGHGRINLAKLPPL